MYIGHRDKSLAPRPGEFKTEQVLLQGLTSFSGYFWRELGVGFAGLHLGGLATPLRPVTIPARASVSPPTLGVVTSARFLVEKALTRRRICGLFLEMAKGEPRADPDDYVFTPESEVWRVNCHANGLLFGPAAVLLQIAHPRIAQGVADHSDFRDDALRRLRRTLQTVNRIAFGTRLEAEEMRERLSVLHGKVQGEISAGMSGPRHYSAFEPDLMLWVLATLIDASIKGYELVWGPLDSDRREKFYREFRRFGTYFELSESEGPGDYREFVDYYEAMLQDDILGSHPLCAEVAAAVVRPPNPLRDRLLGRVVDFLPIETLPEHLRERLHLKSTAWTRLRMAMLRHLAPIAFRVLPKRLTYYPESYRAARSLRIL